MDFSFDLRQIPIITTTRSHKTPSAEQEIIQKDKTGSTSEHRGEGASGGGGAVQQGAWAALESTVADWKKPHLSQVGATAAIVLVLKPSPQFSPVAHCGLFSLDRCSKIIVSHVRCPAIVIDLLRTSATQQPGTKPSLIKLPSGERTWRP